MTSWDKQLIAQFLSEHYQDFVAHLQEVSGGAMGESDAERICDELESED